MLEEQHCENEGGQNPQEMRYAKEKNKSEVRETGRERLLALV